jgi:hypothetical protein
MNIGYKGHQIHHWSMLSKLRLQLVKEEVEVDQEEDDETLTKVKDTVYQAQVEEVAIKAQAITNFHFLS